MIKKEQALKFYLNYKEYVFSVVVVLSSLILIIFVIYPQTSKLISNRQVEEDINQRSKFLEAKAQALESYDQEDLKLKVGKVLSAYPVDKDLVAAVSLLQDFITQSGFSIISISIESGSIKAGTQSFSIKLEILGAKASLPVILTGIENSTRLMRVSSIETTSGRDPVSATASLTVDFLYSSAPEGFGSVDSPIPELSQKDEEVLTKLVAVGGGTTPVVQPEIPLPSELPPRGKANPFE